MPTYEVRIYETLMNTVIVQADSPDDAYELAYDICMNDSTGAYDTESCGTTGEYDIMELK